MGGPVSRGWRGDGSALLQDGGFGEGRSAQVRGGGFSSQRVGRGQVRLNQDLVVGGRIGCLFRGKSGSIREKSAGGGQDLVVTDSG